MMKNSKNKTAIIAATILFICSMTTSTVLLPSANAHTPPWNIPTYAYINVAPDKVGVGQQAYVIMWLDKLYENAYTANTYRFHNYQLVITAPDGTNTTVSFPVVHDTTSAQTYAFTPDTVGTYTLTFTFPGQTIEASNAAPEDPAIGDYYQPSSTSTTLTVQSSPVPAASQGAPLPTAYWTRPIYGENTFWYTISSNWLGSTWPGYAAWGTFTANQQSFPGDAVGSLTSHIMWTKPIQSGGVVGGNNYPALPANTWFEGSAYSQRYMNPLIVGGMLIYNPPLAWDGVVGNFNGDPYGPTTCVDLHTGKVLWTNPDMPAPSFVYLYDAEDPNQHGVWPPVLISSTVTSGLFGNFPGNWYAYDAFTGTSLFNVTDVPAGTVMLGPSGEYLSLSFVNYGTPTSPKIYLQEWNSSRLWGDLYSGPSTVPTLIPPITNGTDPRLLDFNISMPTLTSVPTIDDAFYNNMLVVNTGSFPGPGTFVPSPPYPESPYTYYGINMKQGSIGQILWSNTLQAPAGNLTVSPGPADPTADSGHGVFVEAYKETMQWVGYSMSTGQKLWGPTASMASLDYYGNPAVPIIGGVAANGKLYSTGYAGILYCWNLTTGNLLWTWGNGGTGNSSFAGFNFPFGVYPMQINAIGNDVVYMVTTEHTIETPLNKGAFAVAVNATTGQQIWSLSGYTGEFFGISYAMADGYNTWFNGYDNSIYVVGRGPSQTTVEAPEAALTPGQAVVIRGTVMDISAGTKQDQQAADFPNGVPCASDASMEAWMGYVYQQQAMPINFTGVPVKIYVLDANNNYRQVGNATTNANGMFTFTWTPDISGDFTVYAVFAGTSGYWPSSDATSFAVMSTATQAPTATPVSGLASNLTLEYGIVAIIIVIIIIGAILATLVTRRHP